MDTATKLGCPLCLANGLLKGGKFVGETDQLYAYAFRTEDGELDYALINTKEHHRDSRTLARPWGGEYADLLNAVLALMPEGLDFNESRNDGEDAGQRIKGHYHMWIVPRKSGRPSSGKGLRLLIKEYDELAK